MDIRVTKKRLNDHLSYDWWKYIAILIACIFFWSLVFTMASPRLADGKKMEIYFIADGMDNDKVESFYAKLREKLNPEIIEITPFQHSPGESTTSQVLQARTGVKEGDLYVFTHSVEPKHNSFGGYVDNGLFVDFEKVIEDAIVWGNDIQSRESFVADNPKLKTEEKIEEEYNLYKIRKQRAVDDAETLSGYITDNPELFTRYKRFTVYNESSLNSQEYPIQDEKIWGLDLSKLPGLTDSKKGLFVLRRAADGTIMPFNYSMGITSFKDNNMPYYYENLTVVNFFIQEYLEIE